MKAFQLNSVLSEMTTSGTSWKEFLRVPAMSMGIYRLRPGDIDQQQPHTEDEVYYVLSGRAGFVCGSQRRPAQAGDVLYVDRSVPHRFVEISEELTLLVFFAPAENSLKAQ